MFYFLALSSNLQEEVVCCPAYRSRPASTSLFQMKEELLSEENEVYCQRNINDRVAGRLKKIGCCPVEVYLYLVYWILIKESPFDDSMLLWW